MNFQLSKGEIVPSGSFIVHKSNSVVLKAFLGACVGVAAFDPISNVGGLYHILLPKATSNGVDDPLNFASTGLPLFFKALLDKGAKKTNLKAVIAGGALVGPVTMQDLNLDIGGSTTDIVVKYLKENEIPIEYSETGGYFSCVLNLSTEKWEYEVDPIGQHKISAEINSDKSSISIEEAILKVRPIPQIALKVIRMINSDVFSMESIGREVRQDQILAAKIINLSNSAYISPKRKIETIDEGLVMLGEKRVLLLTLSVFTELYFQNTEQGYSLARGGLFHHSLGTAIVAEFLASKTGAVRPSLAYTAGLLHDIGKTVLDQFVANNFPLFYRKIRGTSKPIHLIEKELFGTTHTEVGGKLAIEWDLPDSLQEVITFHHEPQKAAINSDLTKVVHLADVLMSNFRVNYELERMNTEGIEESMRALGMAYKDLPELIAQIPWNNLEFSAKIPA